MENEGLLHRVCWTPAELSQQPLSFKKVLFIAPEDESNERLSNYQKQLADEGYEVAVLNDPTHIGPYLGQDTVLVHLPHVSKSRYGTYEAATKSCNALISIAQTLQKHSKSIKDTSYRLFSLITQDSGSDDLEYAPLHGLARVLMTEIPLVFGGLFEEDQGLFPTEAFRYAQGYDYVKVLESVPQAAALQSMSNLVPSDQTLQIDAEASYLITGGTSGMGLEIASWLGESGARHIILVSRRGLSTESSEGKDQDGLSSRIAELKKLGATVDVLQVDCSKPDTETSLAKAIEGLKAPPVKGVVHAAGVAEYNTLDRCKPSDVAKVLAPKIIGGLALDSLFPPSKLDFFVLISSFGQLVGFPGQLSYGPANSFLDSLAAQRRRRGDNSTSIQWTCWRGVGLMAQNPSATRMIEKGMAAKGFEDISKEEGLRAFATIISDLKTDHVAVVRPLELEADEPLRHPMLKHVTPRRGSGPAFSDYPSHAVAVVGMACRTAAGDTADDLWEAISTGKSMERELDEARFPDIVNEKKKMWGNFIQGVDSFDNQFFKKSRREAAALDPHQRVLLECAYHALEEAGEFGGGQDQTPEGHDIASGGRVTGCFVGMNAPDYPVNLACNPPSPYTGFGMLRSFVAGRLSHHFGWTGPSHTIDTACSSSMVAIHQACRAIQLGECTRAVAGGVNLITNTALYHAMRVGGFLNDEGACRTFDAEAGGYCRGEGVGVIVLKPLKDALADGDDIKGVLLSTGNNQNINSTSITNPVLESQVAMYKDVLSRAGVDPQLVSYVEAHGTATRAGDPIEVQGIREVLGGKDRRSVLHMGAIKPNIGHSEGAAGMISLIKVLLMLKHGQITPQAHFSNLNPNIDPLEPDKLAISTELKPWSDNLRLALVNSYGASGSNASAILAPPPSQEKSSVFPTPLSTSPIFISAASKAALKRYCKRLRAQIKETSNSISDFAFALATTQNRRLQNVFTTTVTSLKDLRNQLAKASESSITAPPSKPVVLLFSGQNGSNAFSAQPMYDNCQLFRTHIHKCDEAMKSLGLTSIFPAIIEGVAGDADLVLRHAALFAIQYASGMSWIDSGVIPQAVCGHSFGEWAALTVSGALTLEDGVKLVAGRASIIQRLWGNDKGSMVAIEDDFIGNSRTPEQYLEPFLEKHPTAKLDIACHNGPNNYVFAGSTADVELMETYLAEHKGKIKALRYKVLRGMYAYHSILADSIIEESGKLSSSISFHDPIYPFESCHEESWTGPGPNVIARNTREPVYFGSAISRIVDRLGPSTFLEAGIGGPIISMARQSLMQQAKEHTFVAVSAKDPVHSLAEATTALWRAGQPQVQFWPFHRSERSSYTSITLPPYPFEKASHWLEYTDPKTSTPKESAKEETPQSGGLCPNCLVNNNIPYIALDKSQSQQAGTFVFRIDPRSSRYEDLVEGHSVVGTPISPAAMYLELATHAVNLLPDVQGMFVIPEIGADVLEIKAPLGADSQAEIRLTLKAKAKGSWGFELRSTRPNGKPSVHATGTVSFHTSKSTENANADVDEQDVWTRMLALQDDPDSEALRGNMVYKMFQTMANYSTPYRGLRSLVGRDGEGTGVIHMPTAALDLVTRSPNPDIADPLVMDNFLQVPGAFIHSLHPAADGAEDGSMAYICTGMGSVRPLNNLPSSGKYRAYAKIVKEDSKQATLDVFAFDENTKKIVWSCRDLHFQRIPRSSLAKALAAVKTSTGDVNDKPAPTSKVDTKPRSQTKPRQDSGVTLPAEPSKPEEPTVDVFGGIREMLCQALDIPADTVTKEATLEDLGVDSLVASEILSRISEKFSVDLSVDDLATATDVASLCALISSKTTDDTNDLSRTDSGYHSPGSEADKPQGADVLAGVQEVLSQALDISSPETITPEATMEDLGVDSLVASDILSKIADKFAVEISMDDFAEIVDVKALCNAISPASSGRSAKSGGGKKPNASQSTPAKAEASSEGEESIKTVIAILGQSLHLPVEEIHANSTLEDLGVDSLVAVEIIDSLREAFGDNVSAEEFADVEDVASLCALAAGSAAYPISDSPSSSATISPAPESPRTGSPSTGPTSLSDSDIKDELPSKLSQIPIHKAFQSVRRNFDSHAKDTKLTGYWDNVYPQQLDAVTAFIVEGFEKLGCSIDDFNEGDKLPALPKTLEKYDREVPRLWDILEEAGIVEKAGEGYLRGPAPLPSEKHDKPAKELSAELLSDHPTFASPHGLFDLLGPHLADSLTGNANPVSLLFGSPKGRDLLADFYANGPDLLACTKVLCDFFTAAIKSKADDEEPFRVLEIGAGTGGTTKHLMPLLQAAKIPFQFTFTELSGSLLARAKNTTFKGVENMDFRKLDIDKEPPPELAGQYHIVVSSNCVHATQDLNRSLTNIRKLVRPHDGCLALVELTQKLAWFDLVWGLLDGWWLFDDGRKYALQSPWAWEKVMRAAGFAYVDWSDNASRESRSCRVICAMATEPESGVAAKASSALLHRGQSSAKHRNLFLLPDGFGRGAVFGSLRSSLDGLDDISVYILNSPFLDGEYDPSDPPTVEELAGSYVAEIKRRQPDGPYSIGGYSFGGVAAYEASRQLLENGDEVENLVLIDTACPTYADSMPDGLVDFLDAINIGNADEEKSAKAAKSQPINSDHFTLARQQLSLYQTSKLPGRKMPETILFSALLGADKQDSVSRPEVSSDEEKVTNWFLDDRTDDGPLEWDALLDNVTVVRAEGNHFSMMLPSQVDKWGPQLVDFLKTNNSGD